ncbi:DUF883 C-terminal domain-containing protein [Pseudoalteromonas peptidolytica]|uniref:DUF883 C-terminal domain-containing protein n=1 Tax=Pseudoalteromonas peptidolytica TaxID=61150 RepID=UPI00298EA242|nr:DUF883 C-terminal domain-containing protein [Pseudoalteromonas peptidolytica]MDW7547778.1 DUF883 C-terminal domain-containing protein [Pseudoalteromonas peptidolytica]
MSNQANQSEAKNTNGPKANGQDSSHPLTDQIADSLHASVDSLHASASRTETTLREKSHHSGETIDAKRKQFAQAWNNSTVKKYAEENPVKTAGIAFSIGMLATMLLRKK